MAFMGELASRGFYAIGLLGLPFLIFAMLFLLRAYRIVLWQQGPNIDRILFAVQGRESKEAFYREAVEAMAQFYRQNETGVERKSDRIDLASRFIVAGSIGGALGAIIYLFAWVAPWAVCL